MMVAMASSYATTRGEKQKIFSSTKRDREILNEMLMEYNTSNQDGDKAVLLVIYSKTYYIIARKYFCVVFLIIINLDDYCNDLKEF